MMVVLVIQMIDLVKDSMGFPPIAHWEKRDPKISHRLQRTKRFPDFVLCGHLNLHRSAENAAALARHINKQWDYLRINRDGVMSSAQLEINRDPSKYGGLRDGKPLTVSEWQQLQSHHSSWCCILPFTGSRTIN